MDFLVRRKKQASEQSIEVSNVTEVEEHKTIKVMFFEVRDIVFRESLPKFQTINQYVTKRFNVSFFSVLEKRRELRQNKSCLLHHDSTPCHNILSIPQFLAARDIAIL